MLVLLRSATAPCCRYDICQRGILLTLYATTLPFISQQFAYFNTLQSLVDPTLGIAQPPVICDGLFYTQFRVLQLLQSLYRHLCHPLLEGLCLGRRYCLDDAEKLLRIAGKGLASLARMGGHQYMGTICPHVGIQLRVALAHLLQIIARVFAVGQYFNHIYYAEVPLLLIVIPYNADFSIFKQFQLFFLSHI